MHSLLTSLVQELARDNTRTSPVIPWSSPVPVFGNPQTALVATLGLNPSNREFVDAAGQELEGTARRFHTLKSLGLRSWSEARINHIEMLADSCFRYFTENPYDTWFRRLDTIIGDRASFYGKAPTACHLDLVPYATTRKWTSLLPRERKCLLDIAGDTLGTILRDSSIRVLLLNGSGVANYFLELSQALLRRRTIDEWSLPRSETPVPGYSYHGRISHFATRPLGRDILVLGYNHNIQSSFGVTKSVVNSIRRWFSRSSMDSLPSRRRGTDAHPNHQQRVATQ